MEYRIKEYKCKKYTQYCIQVNKNGVWITLFAAKDKAKIQEWINNNENQNVLPTIYLYRFAGCHAGVILLDVMPGPN